MRTRSRQVVAALQRKFGPLPAWAWALLLGVAIYAYRSRQSGGGAIQSAAATTDTGGGAGGGTEPQSPVTLSPGESAYDPNTGQLVSTAPDQQPGTTPEPQPPVVLLPGEAAYDPGTGKLVTNPKPTKPTAGKGAGKGAGTGKGAGAGKGAGKGKPKRSAAQMRKDSPAMVQRVKDRILKARRQHQPNKPVDPKKPRSGGTVKTQPGRRMPGPKAGTTPGSNPKGPKNRQLNHAATQPAAPRANATTKAPVTVKAAPMRQRPAAPTVKTKPAAAKPAAKRKR